MILYHGTDVVIEKPLFNKGRKDVDFGKGFYLTEDRNMAQKWSCNKTPSIVNEYTADISMLKAKKLTVSEEWLDYVIFNRAHEGKIPFDDTQYDVIVGPTANDKLFATLDLYTDGVISKEQTINVINCMNYSNQYVFKNNKAIEVALKFNGFKELKGFERQNVYNQMIEDRKIANKRALELIRKGSK
jgi:hypothetical protein